MRPLQQVTESDSLITIADEVFALALPPPTYGLLPSWAKDAPELDLEVWSNAAVNLTNAVLYGAARHPYVIDDVQVDSVTNATETLNVAGHALLTGDGPVRLRNRIALVYADKVFTATNADETFHAVAHGLKQSDGPFQVSNAGGALPAGLVGVTDYWVILVDADSFKLAASLDDADAGIAVAITTNGTGVQTISDTADTERDQDDLPAGLSQATDYYVIKTGAGTLKLATSLDNAMLGTAVEFTDDGTGVVYIVDKATTQRVHWQTHDGLLGLAADGAIPLTAQVGYRKRIPHSPRVFAYALVATLDVSNPEWVSAAMAVVVDAP